MTPTRPVNMRFHWSVLTIVPLIVAAATAFGAHLGWALAGALIHLG